MPRFNGRIVYPFEVLTQLLWCYLLFGAFYLFLFGAAISLFGGDLSGFMVLPMVSASTPSAPALVLQFVTMSAFRICFWPRFPYVPGFLTFTLAMLFATTISTIALAIERLFRSRNSSVDAVLQWATDHADELGGWALFTVVVSLVGGLINHVLFVTGAKTAHLRSPWRWLGWLFVGQKAYEDFVERENARLCGTPFQAEPESHRTA